MASTRILGKGRTLGAPPQPSQPSASHPRNHVVQSPSGSSISLDSQNSNLLLPNETPSSISAAAALGSSDNATVPIASSRMVCPICNEEMVTLLQLNRHLDDEHQHLEEVEQDEVKTWFKSQMIKAKKFQPIAVLNQKLKGLDMFETNDIPIATSVTTSPARHASPSPAPKAVNPEDVVTRQHWQRLSPENMCSDPMCGKRLGGSNGNINCRHCGKLFCEEHTMYQMKLSQRAEHDTVRGYWSRVCETCYKSRDGYNDRSGVERDHTQHFIKVRRKTVDKSYLEVSRLEKRLTKLTQLLSDPKLDEHPGPLSYFRSFSGSQTAKRLAEHSIVQWEDDTTITSCPFCQQEFTSYTFRRHHCRLCGRVVCADPQTACSNEVDLDLDSNQETPQANEAKSLDKRTVSVRMCKDCSHTLFSKDDFARELAHIPPDLRAYQNLQAFERGIRIMLPRFQKLLAVLQDPDHTPTPTQLAEATKTRKRLTDSFTQYDIAARRIRDLPTTSPTQLRLQKAIYAQASSFLHLHMLPLKALPRLLKHASPYGTGTPSNHSRNSSRISVSPNGHLTPNRFHNATSHLSDGNNPPSTTGSSALSSLESEERQLRERLIVLEEQRFMVETMVADANKRRKFDEVNALGANLSDLQQEISGVMGLLEGLRVGFEGIYVGGIGGEGHSSPRQNRD